MFNFSKTKFLKLMLILFCMCNTTYAKTINIKSTHTYIVDAYYYLDTSFDFTLTEEAEKALRHGIPIEIHSHFQLRLKRKWFWDKTISEKKIMYKLEHKPLTENYLTINLNNGLRNSHTNLDSALDEINTVTKMKLFDLGVLRNDENYIARIKTFLDVGSLPSPMRPQAYFSSNWNISSEWYEWEVTQ